MPILSRKHKLLFIMTPRTGCSAIGKVLRGELEGEFVPAETILDSKGKARVQMKHATLSELLRHRVLTKQDVESLFVFCTIRNPFDSIVSLYVKKQSKYQPLLDDPNSWVYQVPGYVDDMRFCRDHTFDEWIVKTFKPSLLRRMTGRASRSMFQRFVKGTNAVLRFESLQEDFSELLERAGVSTKHEVPLFNRTEERKSGYRDFYSDKSRKIVESVFQDDLRTFGYCF